MVPCPSYKLWAGDSAAAVDPTPLPQSGCGRCSTKRGDEFLGANVPPPTEGQCNPWAQPCLDGEEASLVLCEPDPWWMVALGFGSQAGNLSTRVLHWVPIHKHLDKAPSVVDEKSFTLAANLPSGLRMCRGQEKRLNFSGWTCKPCPNEFWVSWALITATGEHLSTQRSFC